MISRFFTDLAVTRKLGLGFGFMVLLTLLVAAIAVTSLNGLLGAANRPACPRSGSLRGRYRTHPVRTKRQRRPRQQVTGKIGEVRNHLQDIPPDCRR